MLQQTQLCEMQTARGFIISPESQSEDVGFAVFSGISLIRQ